MNFLHGMPPELSVVVLIVLGLLALQLVPKWSKRREVAKIERLKLLREIGGVQIAPPVQVNKIDETTSWLRRHTGVITFLIGTICLLVVLIFTYDLWIGQGVLRKRLFTMRWDQASYWAVGTIVVAIVLVGLLGLGFILNRGTIAVIKDPNAGARSQRFATQFWIGLVITALVISMIGLQNTIRAILLFFQTTRDVATYTLQPKKLPSLDGLPSMPQMPNMPNLTGPNTWFSTTLHDASWVTILIGVVLLLFVLRFLLRFLFGSSRSGSGGNVLGLLLLIGLVYLAFTYQDKIKSFWHQVDTPNVMIVDVLLPDCKYVEGMGLDPDGLGLGRFRRGQEIARAHIRLLAVSRGGEYGEYSWNAVPPGNKAIRLCSKIGQLTTPLEFEPQ